MQPGACGLTHHPKTRQGTAAPGIGGHPAHVVMRRGHDGDWLSDRINPGAAAGFGHSRKACQQMAPNGRAGIERGRQTRRCLRVDGARHHIARRKFGIRVQIGHEAMAVAVDEDSPFAAQRLGQQRRRVERAGKGRRMELHEFGIRDARAHPRGQADPLPADPPRVGGAGKKTGGSARCQNHRRGHDRNRPPPQARKLHTTNRPIRNDKLVSHQTFGNFQMRGPPHRCNKCRDDRRPGLIAKHPRHPCRAVGRFARQGKPTPGIAVEWHPQIGQRTDMGARALCHQRGDTGIRQTGTGTQRICYMQGGAVTRPQGGSDPSLRPSRACPLPERLWRDKQDRARCQPQGHRQACKPRAQNYNPAGAERPGHAAAARVEISIIRSIALRAGVMMAGSTSTGVVMLCSDHSTFSSVIIFI